MKWPYRCARCGQAYKHAGSLTAHMPTCANRSSNKPKPLRVAK